MAFILVVMTLLVIGLLWGGVRTAYIFTLAAFSIYLVGIIDTTHLLSSFYNPSIVLIFLLLFITKGLADNFRLNAVFDKLLGTPRRSKVWNGRLTVIVSMMSGLLNNTPIVALLIPYVQDKSRHFGHSSSKVLMPLSFAAILGGMLTLIGTSTNLVLNGLLDSSGENLLSTGDFLLPGMLVVVTGLLYLNFFSFTRLPSRPDPAEGVRENLRQYLAETIVTKAIHRQTVKQSGLRNLGTVFLVELRRDGEVISPVEPETILHKDDVLIFAGETDKLLHLVQSTAGLDWLELNGQAYTNMHLVEAVIPGNSDLVGNSLKQSGFRERFDAAVVAMHRKGEPLSGALGEIKLKAGDLMMLTTGKQYARNIQNDRNLYNVGMISELYPVSKIKKQGLLLLALCLTGGVLLDYLSFFKAVTVVLVYMLSMGFMSIRTLVRTFDWQLLLTLASALTLGQGLINSGAAQWISVKVLNLFAGQSEFFMLVLLYLLTVLFTSFISNVAALSIIFPLTYQIVGDLGVEGEPFYLAIAFAASAAFATPVAYQTNLMIVGPGNYRLRDFVSLGVPLLLIYSSVILSYFYLSYDF